MTCILACIDGSAVTPAVCDYAAWASKRLATPLTLLHVLDEARYPATPDFSANLGYAGIGDLQQQLSDLDQRRNQLALVHGQAMLDAACQRVTNTGVRRARMRQEHGDLVTTLRAWQAETRLLVIGKQGVSHPQQDALVGDHVERIVRSVSCPVLIATGDYAPPRAFMIAFDGSPLMQQVVQRVAASDLLRGLQCHLVSVGDSGDARTAAVRQLREAGLSVEAVTLSGNVEHALHGYQIRHELDLVVMGAYGHSRLREFFLGSTTNLLLRGATVPHLVLR